MAPLQTSFRQSLRRRFSVTAAVTSSNGTVSGLSGGTQVPRPVIDYNRIVSNRNACAKNLTDRKSHLTPDAIEDVAYLYAEFKNLSRKLLEAKQRQNSLGNKIKQAIGSLSSPDTPKKDAMQTQAAMDPGQEDQPLLDEIPLSRKKTNEALHQSLGNNLELAAKVNDYHSEAASLKDAIANLSKDGLTLEKRLLELATQLPNDIHPSVPIGPYEQSEIVSLSSGCTLSADPLPFNSFENPSRPPDPHRDHLKIMTELGWLSFSDGQKTSGPSFPFLAGNGAFLELALTQYAVSLAVRSGWNLVIGPDIIRTELSERCGFSPRDGGESNHTYFVSTHKSNQIISSSEEEEGEGGERSLEHLSVPNLCLAGTAEIPLVGSFHSSVLPNKCYPDFPLSPIQLVSLGTAYRAEAGARGAESRGLYRIHQFRKSDKKEANVNLMQVSSASNCTDYQSRRLGIRTKVRQESSSEGETAEGTEGGRRRAVEKPGYVHTLNATMAAMPRLVVSLVENGVLLNQNHCPIGLKLPAALKPFWLGDHANIQWLPTTSSHPS
ncbi:hypothetical protein VP01_526g11 [Puccinia sorghi]|uniref:Seryl-tRNA synthetase n=1 Tax=Puccinia sorghi TaxID=27349 RepID=A0A0L6UKF7_9BASI|nr:hypothetical protein VP01_526g11 [Puccinia sorghi]